jgi:hypothetical protein
MTATALKKYRKLLYDKNGKPVMVQLDLTNEIMKKAYEKTFAEIEDLMNAKEAMARDNGQGRPFEEFAKEYLQNDD